MSIQTIKITLTTASARSLNVHSSESLEALCYHLTGQSVDRFLCTALEDLRGVSGGS